MSCAHCKRTLPPTRGTYYTDVPCVGDLCLPCWEKYQETRAKDDD